MMKVDVLCHAGDEENLYEERLFPFPCTPFPFQTFSDTRLIFAPQNPTAASKKFGAGGRKKFAICKII